MNRTSNEIVSLMLSTIALISTIKIYIILTHSDVGETGTNWLSKSL